MANVDRPNGARVIGTMSGSAWNAAVRYFSVDSSAANIFPGDFVIMEADGKVAPATAGSTELIGVCVGVPHYMPTKTNGKWDHFMSSGTQPDLSIKYHETGAAGGILVAVGTDLLYEMQEDDGGTALALTDIGANCDILATAGSTDTGTSRQEIDRSTVNTTTAQLRLVDFVDRRDNEIGDHARWIVRINESHYNKTAGI